MQPLGLNRRQMAEYHELLMEPHDFEIRVAVLDMEEKLIGMAAFKDGQVNLQRDGLVKRTATVTLYDPDHSLHLDTDSPFAGAVFADRMIRVRHKVELSDGTDVVATPFVGPVIRIGREGDEVVVECQDKTLLAVNGCQPKTVQKGQNAVDAIRDIMADCTGERRFRFPQAHKARLSRNYSVGWKEEASPWRVCQKIAASIDMQLIYSCDGALVLRRRPRAVSLSIAEHGRLTGFPRMDYDATGVKNHVRVTGQRKPKKGEKQVKFTETATAKPTHPMAPARLGRHGVPRFLPLLVDDSSIHKDEGAKARANRELRDALPMQVSMEVPSVPFFHLDYGDLIAVRTEFGDANLPFTSASIPLGLSGDQTVGAVRRVSRPRRRSR
jgi:hypothetical protein